MKDGPITSYALLCHDKRKVGKIVCSMVMTSEVHNFLATHLPQHWKVEVRILTPMDSFSRRSLRG